MRRAYATIHAMMTGKDNEDVTVNELDAASVIDFGKGKTAPKRPFCRVASFDPAFGGFDCRTVDQPSWYKMHTEKNFTNDTSAIKYDFIYEDYTTGLFDFLGMPCFSGFMYNFFLDKLHPHLKPEVLENVTQLAIQNSIQGRTSTLHQYDTIIFGMGIWEGVRARDCSKNLNATYDLSQRVDLLLRSLAEMSAVSKKNIQIVLRTPGFQQDHSGDAAMWHLNEKFKNFAHRRRIPGQNLLEKDDRDVVGRDLNETVYSKTNQNAKITVVDFGTVIWKRSFGNDRIIGDMKPHYGLQARLLFAQQLLHELTKEELERNMPLSIEGYK